MGVFDALDDTVERPRHGTESLARFVDRLMVSGTDGRVGLAEPCGDPGVRGQPDLLVEEHALPVAMQLGVLDVGDEGAAERHVDHLGAPTDAEDGGVGVEASRTTAIACSSAARSTP